MFRFAKSKTVSVAEVVVIVTGVDVVPYEVPVKSRDDADCAAKPVQV